MASSNLIGTIENSLPPTLSISEDGGKIHPPEPKQALTHLAAMGCCNGVYQSDDDTSLAALLQLTDQVDDNSFLARLALFSRERGVVRDMPAALLLILSRRDSELFRRIFDRVVDDGRVLRRLFQMIRSGQFGRKSLAYALQRAFQRWLNRADVDLLLAASLDNEPSLRDVLRLARPTPPDNSRRALFGWLTGKPVEKWDPACCSDLPEEVRDLIAFRQATENAQVALLERRRFDWQLLAPSARGPRVWKAIARQMGPHALCMHLPTLLRHRVFQEDAEMADLVAERLADATEIRDSRLFPYQFLAAYLDADERLPAAVRDSLAQAAEIACGNVPELRRPIVIGVDVSASMATPVSGCRGPAGKTRGIDVAALITAALMRSNPDSVVIPFDTQPHYTAVRPTETVLSLAARLSNHHEASADCSIPLAVANRSLRNRHFGGCVLLSAGQHCFDSTGMMTQWDVFLGQQQRLRCGDDNAGPRLVCIDVYSCSTPQAPERPDILNIGGFGDAVFKVVASFLTEEPTRLVAEVEALEL